MKSFKYAGFVFLLLVTIIGCKKVKLDDDRGKLLVGKWKYQYFGEQISSSQFQVMGKDDVDYTIEFFEKGEIEIISEGEVNDYRITDMGELNNGFYSKWANRIYCKVGKEQLNFNVYYYSQDSIMISDLPYPSNSFLNSVGNMFYRVE
jgi:hypothetical protein